MEIEGPLILAVQDNANTHKRELHVSFTQGFTGQKVFERVESLQSYMDRLKHHMQGYSEDDPNRIGMEMVLQMCENLLESLHVDELDIHQTFIIEIQPAVTFPHFLMTDTTINRL